MHLPTSYPTVDDLSANPAARPERSRWVVVLLGGLLASLFLAFLGLHLITPFDDAHLQPGGDAIRSDGILVTPLENQPGGLLPGDLVIATAGQPLEYWAQALFRTGVDRPAYQIGEPVPYTVLRLGRQLEVLAVGRPYPFWQIAAQNWGTIFFALAYALVAVFVFARRPDHRAARVMFISAAAILSATTWSFGLQMSDITGAVGFWLYKATSLGAYTLFFAANLHFALIFPGELPPVRRFRWLVPGVYLLPYLWAAGYLAVSAAYSKSSLEWLSRWIPAEALPAVILLFLTLASILWQYRRNRSGPARLQMRWLTLGTLIAGGFGFLLYILPGALGLGAISTNLLGPIVLIFPLTLAVAILRFNLFDIDTLLNRALVYGSLTALVAAFYVVVVGGLGALFQTRYELLFSLIVTGLVAVLIQPLANRLQRLVNRMMYGERDDPYDLLRRLDRQLEASLSPETTLPVVVESLSKALKLPFVSIELLEGGQRLPAVSYGLPPAPAARLEVLPLVAQNQTVGWLAIAPRASGETFSPAEQRLLQDIARHLGAVAAAVLLTRGLQRSRQRLVTAREEERRRLRRELHDGLGPQLAGLTLRIDAARNMLLTDPKAAGVQLDELKNHTRAALAEVRQIAYNLRPPVLDQLGLVEAIRSQVQAGQQTGGLNVELHLPKPLPDLPAAVEVAAYRITLEAFSNVIQHAAARSCRIRLEAGEWLEITVSDDGVGLPGDYQAGVGLSSMRERAEELGGQWSLGPNPGGGSRVQARLPLVLPLGDDSTGEPA